MTEWVSLPEIKGVEVYDPKGKVTGEVSIIFTSGGRVIVRTNVHVNTTPEQERGVVYRDTEWSVQLHLQRSDDGAWSEWQPEDFDVSKRYVLGGGYATEKQRAAIVDAMKRTAAQHWTRELADRGEFAYASQQLHRLDDEISDAEKVLQALRDKAAPYHAIRIKYLEAEAAAQRAARGARERAKR